MSITKHSAYEYIRGDRTILCNGIMARVDLLSAISVGADADGGPYVRLYIIGYDPIVRSIDVKDKYKSGLSNEDIRLLLDQLIYDVSEFVQSTRSVFDIQSRFDELSKELLDSRRLYDTSMYD